MAERRDTHNYTLSRAEALLPHSWQSKDETPSRAYGKDLILEIAGTSRTDEAMG